MTEDTKPETAALTHRTTNKELATRIYVDLLGRYIAADSGAEKISGRAPALAKLSFQLAEIFAQVEEDLNAANLPKNPTYKLASDDIASWMK